jgi:hypothetical protein
VYYHTPLLIVKMSCQVWSVWGYEYKCLVEPKKTSNRALQDSADSGLNFQILRMGRKVVDETPRPVRMLIHLGLDG